MIDLSRIHKNNTRNFIKDKKKKMKNNLGFRTTFPLNTSIHYNNIIKSFSYNFQISKNRTPMRSFPQEAPGRCALALREDKPELQGKELQWAGAWALARCTAPPGQEERPKERAERWAGLLGGAPREPEIKDNQLCSCTEGCLRKLSWGVWK